VESVHLSRFVRIESESNGGRLGGLAIFDCYDSLRNFGRQILRRCRVADGRLRGGLARTDRFSLGLPCLLCILSLCLLAVLREHPSNFPIGSPRRRISSINPACGSNRERGRLEGSLSMRRCRVPGKSGWTLPAALRSLVRAEQDRVSSGSSLKPDFGSTKS
jgi:hypothetical protein